MTKQPNILMIVTDQEYAHQSLPAGLRLVQPGSYSFPRGHF